MPSPALRSRAMRLGSASRAQARPAGAARAPIKLTQLDQSHRTVLGMDGGGMRGLLTGARPQAVPAGGLACRCGCPDARPGRAVSLMEGLSRALKAELADAARAQPERFRATDGQAIPADPDAFDVDLGDYFDVRPAPGARAACQPASSAAAAQVLSGTSTGSIIATYLASRGKHATELVRRSQQGCASACRAATGRQTGQRRVPGCVASAWLGALAGRGGLRLAAATEAMRKGQRAAGCRQRTTPTRRCHSWAPCEQVWPPTPARAPDLCAAGTPHTLSGSHAMRHCRCMKYPPPLALLQGSRGILQAHWHPAARCSAGSVRAGQAIFLEQADLIFAKRTPWSVVGAWVRAPRWPHRPGLGSVLAFLVSRRDGAGACLM